MKLNCLNLASAPFRRNSSAQKFHKKFDAKATESPTTQQLMILFSSLFCLSQSPIVSAQNAAAAAAAALPAGPAAAAAAAADADARGWAGRRSSPLKLYYEGARAHSRIN